MDLPAISTSELVALGSGLVVGGALGAGTVAIATRKKRKKSRKSKSKKSSRKGKARRKLKFGSPAYRKKYLGKKRRKTPRTAGKGKDRSTRRIRMTSKGQPYIIKADGRARFISKASARSSRKRKGGRY